jgi:hypothetical protein
MREEGRDVGGYIVVEGMTFCRCSSVGIEALVLLMSRIRLVELLDGWCSDVGVEEAVLLC